MSESFPFAPAAEAEAAGGEDKRKLVVVAAVGALLVAVLGYFVVVPALSGGGDDAPVTAVRKPQPKADTKKTDAKAKAKQPVAKKPAVQPAQYSDVHARSNPFRPLWVEPKVETGTSAPAGTPGTAPGVPVGAQPGPGTGTGTGSSTGVGGQRVSLMTVYAQDGVQYAQTKVGDVVYTPRVGQVFASVFKLLAVSGKTATYLYGDEQFTLSVGQEVLK